MTAPDNETLSALSITSCFNLIKSYFTSQDNNSAYKSLTRTTEGTFLIRVMATVLSNLSYRIISYFREAFISTANLLSSVTGIAVNLGYSVYRGSNQRRLITVTPSQTVVLPKFSVIGTYNNDYDIINLEDTTLQENVQVEVLTVIGKVKTIQQRAGTSELKTFTFYTEKISEDLVLLKDSVEVPFSKVAKDMADDKYWVRTNPFGSIDIQYLNDAVGAQYTYNTESIFTIKYIELADAPSIQYISGMFTYFTLDNTRVIEKYNAPETVQRIKITAPYSHEVQSTIRAREDYPKRFPEINTKITYSDLIDITPEYVAVSYLKNDLSFLTSTERTNLKTTLEGERSIGAPLPDITNPKRDLVTLDISIKPLNNLVSLANVNTDLNSIFEVYYENIVNKTLDTFDVEKLIEQLSYVKYARVTVNEKTRIANTYYNIGDVILKDDINYKACEVLGQSDSLEPLWNVPALSIPATDIDTELDTIDNSIVWRTYKKLDISRLENWQANTKYKIGDYVLSTSFPYYMFKVVDLIKYNDEALSATPSGFSTGEIGDFVNDGNILWVRKLLNMSHPDRTANTNYRLGDNIKVGSYSYECVGYRGKTDEALSTTPIFELDEYIIVDKGADYFEITGDYSAFFKEDDVLKVFVSNSLYYSFSVDTVAYLNSTGRTRVTVNQTVVNSLSYTKIQKEYVGTQDGFINWVIVDDNTKCLTSWKSYNSINYDLTIL